LNKYQPRFHPTVRNKVISVFASHPKTKTILGLSCKIWFLTGLSIPNRESKSSAK
jgi:hypothetical protein